MSKVSTILGINARTQRFAYRYNTKLGKMIADSKIRTDRVLTQAGVPHPKIYKKFRDPQDVLDFDWMSLPDQFALKPSRGLGGEGIIVVKKRAADGKGWLTVQKEKVSPNDLKLHTLDILEGAYSMGNEPDVAFVQEYVGRAEAFRRYAYRGTPDIRLIVFNKIPVMAMLRLPTKESGGRANLHQGAVGVGIDIATGITTRAIWHGDEIVYKPGTGRALRGIKIPSWDKVLETAVRAQEASHLGYLGVDIVIHPEKGPMVLELNAQPGLQIQLANGEGLKKRLERVEDLDVRDVEHGVNIAKTLFSGRYVNRKAIAEGIKTIGTKEEVKIVGLGGRKKEAVWAKVDTGAWRSSIDRDLAERLGLLSKENILWERKVKSTLGVETRPVINLKYYLAGRKIVTIASVANRSKMRRQFIIGRRDLGGFMVKI
jgi:alpha-L-glutamate ligase-like protein